MSKLTAWLRQPTTITGIASLVGLVATVIGHYLTGDLTASAAAGALVFGVIHVAMPDNTALATTLSQMASNVVAAEVKPGPAAKGPSAPAAIAVALTLAGALSLAACSSLNADVVAAAKTPAGALFCSLSTAGGPQVVTLIDATESAALASAGLPAGAAVAVLATNAAASAVQADCAAAAKATGAASGIPVSPPPSGTAPVVAIPAAAKS